MNLQRTWSAVVFGGVVILGSAGCARPSIDAAVGDGSPKPGPNKGTLQVAEDKPAGPADKGSKLLRETLGPPQKLADESVPGPMPQPVPAAVAHPQVPLPSAALAVKRPALVPPAVPLRPHALPDGVPLTSYRGQPAAVAVIHLPGGALVRVASPNVNTPPPLPTLARLTIDQVPVDDPTTEDSIQAALTGVLPIRLNPVPFQPVNLPDPFENAQAVRLRNVPSEVPDPAVGPAHPPKP